MAQLNENLFKSGKGSIGKVVVYSMFGKTYMRSRPAEYNDCKSPAQLAQRQKMKVVTDFLKPFQDLIRTSFAGVAVGRAPYHEAKSYIMKHAVEGEYPDQRINISAVLLSMGSVMLPGYVDLTMQQDGILFTWDNATNRNNAKDSDTLVVITQDKKTKLVDYQFTGVKRYDGKFLWNKEGALESSDEMNIWIAFQNKQKTEMSDSLLVK